MQAPMILPITTIQPDFEDIIQEVRDGVVPEDKFWVSCYKTGEPSVHGKVHATLDEKDRDLVVFQGRDGVDFKHHGGRNYTTACPSMGISNTTTAVPSRSYSDPLPKASSNKYRKICAFDISPDGMQFASGYDDGSVYIIPTTSPSPVNFTTSKPHLSTVTSLRFFPSSRVILTASLDLSLHILPADPPSPSSTSTPIKVSSARSFKGHSRGISSASIIARGRNILSASRDGTLRLWDVSSGSQIRFMGVQGYSPILAMSTGERGEGAFARPPYGDDDNHHIATPASVDTREVETADKVAFCALQNGSFQVYDLGSKSPVYHSTAPRGSPALQSIAYAPEVSMVATGTVTGIVSVYDTRALGSPLVSFSRNGASIEDLSFMSCGGGSSAVGLAIATEDGLPYVAGVRPEGPEVYAELVGTDCEAVRCVRVRSGTNEVWTAGDDGIVRKYEGLDSYQ